MENEKKINLLKLRYEILYAINHAYKRDLDNALKLLDHASILLQKLHKQAVAKESMFYQIMQIGLNNAQRCLHKKQRTISIVEMSHISDIPLMFLVEGYTKEQEEYYWNVVKVEYETHSKRELVAQFKKLWNEMIQSEVLT